MNKGLLLVGSGGVVGLVKESLSFSQILWASRELNFDASFPDWTFSSYFFMDVHWFLVLFESYSF